MKDINLILKELNKENLTDFLNNIEEIGKTKDRHGLKQLINLFEYEKYPSHITPDIIKKINSSIIKILSHIGTDESLNVLIKALNSKNVIIKNMVSKALGEMKDKRSVDPLIRMLKDDNVNVSSAEALGEIADKRAIVPLISLLKHKNGELRSSAAISLGKIKDPVALGDLLEVLEKDTDVNVRRLAAIALGELGDERALPVLIRKLDDQFMNVATSAADAMVKIGKPSVKCLINVIENKLASDALIKIGELSVDELINNLSHENENIRKIAARSLGKIGSPRSVKPLVLELKNNTGKTLKTIRDSIFFICSSSLTPLSEALHDLDETSYEPIVDIFFDIGHLTDNGIERLIKELEGNNNPLFQKLLIEALGRLEEPRVIPSLKSVFFKSECKFVKKEIIRTITNLGPREDMIELFLKAFEEDDNDIRELTLKALLEIGDMQCVSLLEKLLSHEDLKLKHIALKGLTLINHPSAISSLIKILKSDDINLILMAIELLNNKKDEEITSVFIDLLNHNNTDIQIASINVLKKIYGKDIIKYLEPLKKYAPPEVKIYVEKVMEELVGEKKSFWKRIFKS